MDWARILAYVTGLVDQELLARSEYLAAENRILKAQLRAATVTRHAQRRPSPSCLMYAGWDDAKVVQLVAELCRRAGRSQAS